MREVIPPSGMILPFAGTVAEAVILAAAFNLNHFPEGV
jgi:hypothetical protein